MGSAIMMGVLGSVLRGRVLCDRNWTGSMFWSCISEEVHAESPRHALFPIRSNKYLRISPFPTIYQILRSSDHSLALEL
ncbi:uncharacterized protein HD556DRAFT_1362386 [Suillus plorans]|uniref:Uncharacterized protein n=1 Tax=Suillus plorans TaxID=116603 RepID=A0A9P7DJP1_9AGAM|nr:uncharacterized protein HD556DRAFT_1362386 [Suillus plorans]KAG1796015.1 hypothetical protein HD556DRAFT_1362386 [Suillus plorans]